jgi:hypothetical protein
LKDVADKTNLHVQTLYKRLYRRQLPVRAVNGIYMVSGDVAQRLLEADITGPKNRRVNLVEVVNEKPQKRERKGN